MNQAGNKSMYLPSTPSAAEDPKDTIPMLSGQLDALNEMMMRLEMKLDDIVSRLVVVGGAPGKAINSSAPKAQPSALGELHEKIEAAQSASIRACDVAHDIKTRLFGYGE